MTLRLVSLPMYAPPEPAQAAFRAALETSLARHGFEPSAATPDDLTAHWLSPDLLLSQTCGYPFRTRLAGRVRLVATPCYDAPGCEGPLYRSQIVVRRHDPATDLAALRGRTAAFNGADSQSGYNAFRAAVAPLSRGGRFFGEAVETGSHRASVEAVLSGRADAAAIDAVTLALLLDRQPALALRTLAATPAAPALPFVTAAAASDAEVARMRLALHEALTAVERAGQGAALRLAGFAQLPVAVYDVVLEQEAEALRRGYPHLA